MTQEEPKEDKLFESVEQMSKIAQDLVRRKTELSQTKQKFVVFEYDEDNEDNDPIGEVVGFIEGSNYIMVKVYDGKQVSLNDDLYETPPQRTWVGLTDKERETATGWSVEHIESYLKQKNGYAEENT